MLTGFANFCPKRTQRLDFQKSSFEAEQSKSVPGGTCKSWESILGKEKGKVLLQTVLIHNMRSQIYILPSSALTSTVSS